VDYVVRYEHLEEDLLTALKHLGIGFSMKLPRAKSQFRKVGDYRDQYDDYARDWVAQVYKTEISLFGYTFSCPSPTLIHGQIPSAVKSRTSEVFNTQTWREDCSFIILLIHEPIRLTPRRRSSRVAWFGTEVWNVPSAAVSDPCFSTARSTPGSSRRNSIASSQGNVSHAWASVGCVDNIRRTPPVLLHDWKKVG
jgi:hypothetical protein